MESKAQPAVSEGRPTRSPLWIESLVEVEIDHPFRLSFSGLQPWP